ncbi:very short patch repair endonuclease [Streptomyces sp. MJM1172]|uniref:very short patch repair endonuclease n=1 Tax=Streptomyces sp. MJM1172 TaxID=1703926 RepID=UPI001F51635E|nr:very short patch repair endonuclease [Streptomyces sp. MJM1172]
MYLGEVEHDSRRLNLAEAWKRAIEAELVIRGDALPASSWAETPAVRASMRGNRSHDTKPEKLLRALLYERGARYRVSYRPLPRLRRTADIAFPGTKVAVFVDGCFWHGCAEHCRWPAVNEEFWRKKIEGNRARDADTNQALAEAGWTSLRVWEHEDPREAADRVIAVVREKRGHVGAHAITGSSPAP